MSELDKARLDIVVTEKYSEHEPPTLKEGVKTYYSMMIPFFLIILALGGALVALVDLVASRR